MALGADLESAWHHPHATAETRKRILRTVLVEIVAKVADDTIQLVLHWQGGDHTRLSVLKYRTGRHRWTADAEIGELVRALARQQPDGAIAATLNRVGKRTGRGNTWTESRVRSFRNNHGIAVYRPGEMAERGELNLQQAADRLEVSKMTVLRLIGSGTIQAYQACKGAPWAIAEAQLSGLDLRFPRPSRPRTENPSQRAFNYQ